MQEFFRGWKRKFGVVTLMMTCVFAVAWVRSLCLQDMLQFSSGKATMEYFASVDNSLIWQRMHIVDPKVASMTMFHVWKDKYMSLDAHLERRAAQTSWYGLGFGVGQPPPQLQSDWGLRCRYCIIPYWSLVIPLIWLSAWLLLSKPRVNKPKLALEM